MSVPTPHDEPATPDGARAVAATHVHVVRGAPDDLELAALVAGLVATAGPDDDSPAPAAEWANRHRALPHRPTATPGPDSWRWSLHP